MDKRTHTMLISNKRVFYNPQKYLQFLKSNQDKIQAVNIRPATLGKMGFGSIEVEMNTISNERKTIAI